MAEPSPPQPPPAPHLALQARPEVIEGRYANFASVRETPYEITIDFAHVDFSSNLGALVARIAMAPILGEQLLTALAQTLERYVQRSIEQEVTNGSTDGSATGGDDGDPAK